jgi:hypothetical protein
VQCVRVIFERIEQFARIGEADGLGALKVDTDVFEAQGIFFVEKLIKLDHQKSACAFFFGNILNLGNKSFGLIFLQVEQILNVVDRPDVENVRKNPMDFID